MPRLSQLATDGWRSRLCECDRVMRVVAWLLLLWVVVATATRADAGESIDLPDAGVATDGIASLCKEISRKLRSVSARDCELAGLKSTEGKSVNGRSLPVRDIGAASPPSLASVEPARRRPRVLLIGGIHGDELVSVSLVFRWLPKLDSGEGMAFEWRAIPLANPDGLLANPSRRTNARGVDLNRNFDSQDWIEKARRYWVAVTRRDGRRNPGESPGSEPETQWLQQQITDFRPDVIITVHAPYGLLDYDGPSPSPPSRFGALRLNRLGVYPGSLGNYAGVDRGIPVITLEFPASSSMPQGRELDRVWSDMIRWMRANLSPIA